tara:strand:- start:29141 stop:29299 length:159 start_codon:yes stop_codon:yes gene_type:complete
MPTKKKETKIEPIIPGPTLKDITEIWDVIDEIQENLRFINDKIKTMSSRLGV